MPACASTLLMMQRDEKQGFEPQPLGLQRHWRQWRFQRGWPRCGAGARLFIQLESEEYKLILSSPFVNAAAFFTAVIRSSASAPPCCLPDALSSPLLSTAAEQPRHAVADRDAIKTDWNCHHCCSPSGVYTLASSELQVIVLLKTAATWTVSISTRRVETSCHLKHRRLPDGIKGDSCIQRPVT